MNVWTTKQLGSNLKMGSGLTKTIAVILPLLSLALGAGWYVFSGAQESATELPSVPQGSTTEVLSAPQESATELPSASPELPSELPTAPQESTTDVLSAAQESTRERMDRLCGSCGVTTHDANKLITNVQRVEIKRKDAIALFKMSFREFGDAEVCAACAEAIMDVVDEVRERP